MKKLIVALMLLISTQAIAGDNKIYVLTNPVVTARNTQTNIVCIDGYKYAISQTESGDPGVTMVQLFKASKYDAKPTPVKCNE